MCISTEKFIVSQLASDRSPAGYSAMQWRYGLPPRGWQGLHNSLYDVKLEVEEIHQSPLSITSEYLLSTPEVRRWRVEGLMFISKTDWYSSKKVQEILLHFDCWSGKSSRNLKSFSLDPCSLGRRQRERQRTELRYLRLGMYSSRPCQVQE